MRPRCPISVNRLASDEFLAGCQVTRETNSLDARSFIRRSWKQGNMDSRDAALLALGIELRKRGYRFITVTPASHKRVNQRSGKEVAGSLEDVFGWSRPFAEGMLPPGMVGLLNEAQELESSDGLLRSKVRFSTLGSQLFVHSAFPTEQTDAVFFGPDTYRFARALAGSLMGFAFASPLRIFDVGCGSGAGGLAAGSLLAHAEPQIVLSDINPLALRYSRVNAALNDVANISCLHSDLYAALPGSANLIISNPPYLVDPVGRLYRHGGGALGFELSLRIVTEGIDRLAPGGRLFLYSGSAVIDGTQMLFERLYPTLTDRDLSFTCEEIDPDVFGEELEHPPYDRADRIAAVAITIDRRK
jgi:release factor glutamine methyltransferase